MISEDVSDAFQDPSSACKIGRKQPLNRVVRRVPKKGQKRAKTTSNKGETVR